MAGSVGLVTGTGALRSGVTVLARVRGAGGQLLTQASLSALAYTVRDLTAGVTVVAGVALTIAAAVFDALEQSDPRWDRDSLARPGPDGAAGYNFAAEIPAADFVAYDVASAAPFNVTPHKYQIDVKFTPVNGQPFYQSFLFQSIPVYGA